MSSTRRLLFSPCHFLAESWNGIDEHLWLLSKHLDRNRFELLLLVHPTDGPQSQILAERANLRIIPAPYSAKSSGFDRLRELRTLFRRERIDLLHIHSPAAAGHAIPALAAKLAGVQATFVTCHQIQAWRFPFKTRTINRLLCATFIDQVVAVSSGVKDSAIASAGLPRQRIQVIHNGIELPERSDSPASELHAGAGEIQIGYFGRLSPEKSVSLLLRSFSEVAQSCPQARLLIVGDGPERTALEQLAADLHLANRVRFLGFRPDAREIMQRVDIVVHAPLYEGFGLVVLEAMAAGRPVVVNDAPGGLPEIVVHDETGLVVPSGSSVALAKALAGLVNNPAERVRLGRNGRLRCRHEFSARVMAQRISQLYDGKQSSRLAGRRPAEVRNF